MLEVGIKAYKFYVNGRYLCIPISVLVCFFYFSVSVRVPVKA